MASVDGLAFRALWSRLEPSAGVYNWSSLDEIADVARASGKRLTVHIAPDLPTWLPVLGAQTYSFNSPLIGSGTAVVPWDPVFLGRHGAFTSALADHLRVRGDATLLDVVSVGAPVAEMSLPACQNGVLGTTITYDRSQYLAAWRTSFTAHQNAFANSAFAQVQLVVSAPVSQICRPDNDGAAFYSEVMTHALATSPRAGVFLADLNALGSNRLLQVDSTTRAQARLHFQTIWSFSDDPTNRFQGPLRDAVCFGWRAGARYYELYKADLTSSDAAVVSAVATARTGAGC